MTRALLCATLLFGSGAFAAVITEFVPTSVTFTVSDVAFAGGDWIPINTPAGRPAPTPNHVYAISQASPVGSDAVSDLFRSSPQANTPPDGTNVSYKGPAGITHGLRSSGSLGLVQGDKINAISFGADGSGNRPVGLLFSVDPDAFGLAGTAVRTAASQNVAAGGAYAAAAFSPFGNDDGIHSVNVPIPIGSNVQVAASDDFGLAVNKNNPKESRPGNFEDDLDGLEVSEPGMSYYFTLDRFSFTVQSGVVATGDILFSDGGDSYSLFATYLEAGLAEGDDIDALAVSGRNILFSLAPSSPTLLLTGRTAGDVFYSSLSGSYSLYAGHEALGLLHTDNLNALDTYTVPEPSTFVLTGVALGVAYLRAGRAWRRRRRANS